MYKTMKLINEEGGRLHVRQKNTTMSVVGPETKNDFAGEAQTEVRGKRCD
jgi:hypothetical protein